MAEMIICISGRVLSFHQGRLKAVSIDSRRRWIPDNWKWEPDSNGCLVNEQHGKAVSFTRRCQFRFVDTRWKQIDRRIERDRSKVERRWSQYGSDA